MIHILGHTELPFSGIKNISVYLIREIQKKLPVLFTSLDSNGIRSDYLKSDIHLMISLIEQLRIFSMAAFENKKIAYLCSEGTQLLPRLQMMLDTLDEIWVPTHWHVPIYKNYYDKKIYVVHAGVDPKIFNPNVTPYPIFKDYFTFMCVGRFEDQRKNIVPLIKKFLKAFKNEKVKLLLPMSVSVEPPFVHDQLAYIHPVENHAMFAQLYTGADAFVLPTRCEGWGLPICEAMACGLPVITTLYSGVTEYANEDLIYPIQYELADIPYIQTSPQSGLMGLWAQPDMEHMVYQMRYVYTHREEAKEKGLKASRHIMENFTWDRAIIPLPSN